MGIRNRYIFLLYVTVMIIITYLQQEFVLLPQLQGTDVIDDLAKTKVLANFQKTRWLAFLFAPLMLLLRLSLVSLCLLIGGFFFSEMSGQKFKDWWGIAMKAQVVMVVYSLFLCVVNVSAGTDRSMEIATYTSLMCFGNEATEQWIKIPLSAVNLFEIAYWLFMAALVARQAGTNFKASFRFVMSSYGVGYLFYIVLLMFLVLYLT